MRYSELELKRLFNKGHNNLTIEEEIAANILNFISCIHLNKQDFYSESFNSQYFGNRWTKWGGNNTYAVCGNYNKRVYLNKINDDWR